MAFENNEKKIPKDGGNEQSTAKSSAFMLDSELVKLNAIPGLGDRTGTKYHLGTLRTTYTDAESGAASVSNGDLTSDKFWRMPGVAQVSYMPVYGTAHTAGDPINTLAQRLYSKIMEVIKRNTLPYQAVDVVKHLILWDSVRQMYNFLTRAYRMLNTVNSLSLYTPKEYCRAACTNPALHDVVILTHQMCYRTFR